MQYLFLGLGILGLGLLLFIVLNTLGKFDESQKKYAYLVFAGFIFAGVVYTYFQSEGESNYREKITHFQQGGELICNGQKVDNGSYNLVAGTMTFISKEKNNAIKHQVQDCSVNE